MLQERKKTCLELPYRFDVARLRADLDTALGRRWSEHHKRIHYDAGRSGIALRSISGDAADLKASFRYEFRDTETLAACPYFRELVARFRCPVKSVRLLRLAAGERVRTHVDDGLGFDFGMVRIHVPIVTNPGVRFVVAGKLLDLREGVAYYVDTSRPHSVSNSGDADRTHLVLDCLVDDWLRAQFPDAFQRRMTHFELAAGYARTYLYEAIDAVRLMRKQPHAFFRKLTGRFTRLWQRSS